MSSPDLDTLQRLLLALGRRHLVGLRLQTVAVAALVVSVFALGLVVGARWRFDPSAVLFALVLTAGGLTWLLAIMPWTLRALDKGGVTTTARRVERIVPGLEGRLLTLAERPDGPLGGESASILDWIASRTHGLVRHVPHAKVYPLWPRMVPLWIAMALLCVATLTAATGPGGMSGVWAFWSRAFAVVSQDDGGEASDDPLRARVGDILLEYVYPAYTRLDPMEVPNSTGDIHGPPGTLVRVRVRTAEVVDRASVIAYEGEPEEAEVADGRVISGALTIQGEDGEWLLQLERGESTARSRTFTITVEPDLPPVVLTDGPRRLEVSVDAIVEIPWSARDDYGISRAVLVVDGVEVREVRKAEAPVREMAGTVRFTPAQLGMSVGMRARLQVGAYDNNGWSGEQLGLSEPPIELLVLEADKPERLSLEEREALREQLVDLLAGQVRTVWPPGRTVGSVLEAGEAFDRLYQPLRTYRSAHPALARDRFVRRLLQRVVGGGVDFVVYTQVQFDPSQARQGVQLETVAKAGTLRDAAVVANEQAIIMLDRYLSRDALAEVVQITQVAASIGRRLETRIETLSEVDELAADVARVRTATEDLTRAARRLTTGSLRELVERRVSEIDAARQTLDDAIRSRTDDQAVVVARRMARLLDELRDELEYRLRRVDEEEESLGEEVRDVIEMLKRAEREQRVLQTQVRTSRERHDQKGAAAVASAWQEIERLTSQALVAGEGALRQIPESGSGFYARQWVGTAVRSTQRAVQTVQGRDLDRALGDMEETISDWLRTQRMVDESARRTVVARLEQAQRLLHRLASEAETVDPAVAEQVRALVPKQTEVASERDKIEEQAKELISKLPIEPVGMLEALGQAERSMAAAGAFLRRGIPMTAEGAQGVAAEALKEAREALEDVLEQMSAGSGSGGGETGDGGEASEALLDLDEQAALSQAKLELEDEFDLDAFQRDVLRGMQGDVPDTYRALKKRYYEELMTQ